MSDSRLEKFIYAICSMDVSDLPVPLSRIEKLWNCLITGETPDFEPLSRNEKYLMAMLDRYDISNLPAPMSRGEKLLHKIAVGETDLSDVPGYLSRYEELLKYLIENGGISGGDFEYVLYTLNQSLSTLYTTAKKPVKSAILTGQTLVNLLKVNKDNYIINNSQNWSIEDGYLKCVSTTSWHTVTDRFNNMIKPSTKYLIVVEIKENTLNIDVNFDGYDTTLGTASTFLKFESNEVGTKKVIVTTPSMIDSTKKGLFRMPIKVPNEGSILKFRVMAIEYQDGMENWDIPYFEGMQSVKMPVLKTTGKNLFDKNKSENILDGYYIDATSKSLKPSSDTLTVFIENLNGISNLVMSGNGTRNIWLFMDYNGNAISAINAISVSVPNGTHSVYVYVSNGVPTNGYTVENLQIEEGTAATAYEPFKSNILTVNEEVELRGIGDVQDELNCLTGEVTQHVKEVILNGSESWMTQLDTKWNTDTHISFRFMPNDMSTNRWASGKTNCISDKFKTITLDNESYKTSDEFIGSDGGQKTVYFNIKISRSRLNGDETVNGLKQWLSQNPITLQYKVKKESIKTVDLTTVDQNNQPTQLGTFESVTHVSLESAGLIPTVEMEVATNLLEDTVFNLTEAFNTLYPTAAKPVVDGKLYGQTLANLATQKSGRFNGTRFLRIPLSYTLNPNTNYFVNFIVKESTLTDGVTCRFKNTSTGITLGALKSSGIIATNANVADILEIYIDNTDDVTNGLDAIIDDIMVIEYQDGMENWDIPHFEGMRSVQAPGVTITNGDGTKSITLSIPTDLELRKVGEVQDEVNVMTGEVVERIGEMVLNGSEEWQEYKTNVTTTYSGVIRDNTISDYNGTSYLNDKLTQLSDSDIDSEGIRINSGKRIFIRLNRSKGVTDLVTFKQYLSQNPITVQYQLATPTTKTVDLTVVNQDGNETKLRTFDDTTHVLLNSEAGPNPGASLTVRTKIPSASSTSLLMDELSTEQQQLNITVDEQSNNVDATMIATTEIYEETL